MTTFSNWRKSSRSGSQANCVEVGSAPGVIGVRDTKNRDGGTIMLPGPAWSAFIAGVRQGAFDSDR
jgi:hypothetical protein